MRSNQPRCLPTFFTTMPTYTMANKVPMPTMYHCQAPKKMNEKMTAKITNEQSTQIFTFGNSIPVIRLTATGKPSPGMVTEPHLTSKAIPMPRIEQPKTWETTFCHKSTGASHVVRSIFRSMSEPKTKPTKNWNN